MQPADKPKMTERGFQRQVTLTKRGKSFTKRSKICSRQDQNIQAINGALYNFHNKRPFFRCSKIQISEVSAPRTGSAPRTAEDIASTLGDQIFDGAGLRDKKASSETCLKFKREKTESLGFAVDKSEKIRL